MKNANVTSAALFGLALVASAPAGAQVLTERNIPLALAAEIAQGAVEACAQRNFSVAAAVVDRAGVVRALLRADRAGPHTVDSARRKAYTSASLRANTTALNELVGNNPAARHLGQIDGFLFVGGGLPIRVGDEVIGAVGVGGAPGGHLDDECAAAGIARVADRLR